jgi:Uma2 family endonuclease
MTGVPTPVRHDLSHVRRSPRYNQPMTVAEPKFLIGRDTYRLGDGLEPVLHPGTLGWTTKDLEDPQVRLLWNQERYEIIDGVLTVMPPAYFRGGMVVDNLKFLLRSYFNAQQIRAVFSGEVDIAITPSRMVRADGVIVIGEDLPRFEALQFTTPAGTTWKDHVLTLPPTLVIESVSEGHEDHDRLTKRQWYAGFNVPHYWIADGFKQTLECLRLNGDHYDTDVAGAQHETLEPPSFPGLKIPLREIWET